MKNNSEIINQSLNNLIEGNERFVSGNLKVMDTSLSKIESLVAGQKPYAVVIGCSDSRVSPELVFNAGLGEIFVIRVAGNVINDDIIGSIEYAVEILETPLIVVLGHENCGAVGAIFEEEKIEKRNNSIGSLVSKIKKVISEEEKLGLNEEEIIDKVVDLNIINSCKEITKSPVVEVKIDQGLVKVVGAKYIMKTGEVLFL